jgi:hypothetical protein
MRPEGTENVTPAREYVPCTEFDASLLIGFFGFRLANGTTVDRC